MKKLITLIVLLVIMGSVQGQVISDLPVANKAQEDDSLVIEQSDSTRAITKAKFLSYINSDTIYVDTLYADTAYINYSEFGNSTNLITGVLWMGDKNLDSSEINNLKADVAKITDTLGIQSDDGIFTFWNTAGTAKYSWYLDTDTFSFYNHADASIHAKFYPNGETEFFDTVRAPEFYSTGSSVILSDYVFGDDYELLSWNKQVAYWQEHSALPSLHGKEIGKKGVQLGALAARTEGLVEEVEKLNLYMQQVKEENKELTEMVKTERTALNILAIIIGFLIPVIGVQLFLGIKK